MKKYSGLILILLFALFSNSVAVADGIGTIPQLQQLVATTSPVTAITQATYGKSLLITGLTNGQSLCLDVNGVVTTTGCSSGSGSAFPFTKTSYGVSTSTIVGFTNGLLSMASTTINSTLNLPTLTVGGLGVSASGQVYSAATTTAGTGLSFNGTSFTVNTSQNIATLSNLSTNGFVTTSGGIGTLGVQAFPVTIIQGGTATTTGGVTNGVEFYNGTTLTNGYSFNWNGTNLGVGTTTPASILSIGNTNGINFTIATSTFNTTGGIDLANGGCFATNETCINATITNNISAKDSCNYATATTLPAYGYVAGVITETGLGALSIDGGNPSVGQRVLIKNETGGNQSNNGIYTVTVAGSGIASFVLTRASDFNNNQNVYQGVSTYIISGTANADDTYVLTTANPISVGSTALTFTLAANGNANVASVSATYPIQSTGGATPVISTAFGTTTANSFNQLQQLNANASTTAISITNSLTVGGHATTTSAGNISTDGTLNVTGLSTLGTASVTSATSTTLFGNIIIGNSGAFGQSATTTLNTTGGVQFTPSQPATSTAMTLNWATTPEQIEYQIGGSATTVTVINATTSAQWGSLRRVWVCNPNQTAGALTWVGVEWIGTAPSQTTTASQCDLYVLNVTRATSSPATYKVAGAASTGFQ